MVFEFFNCLQSLPIEINLFLPVNANISWIIMLLANFSETVCRYAFFSSNLSAFSKAEFRSNSL